jgi:hypothetical protein
VDYQTWFDVRKEVDVALRLPAGTSTGIGSLPHRDAAAAAAFVFRKTGALPAMPTLPRRSPAEGLVAQAVLGIRGVAPGQYGSLSVDPAQLDPEAPVRTDFEHDAFGGFRAFATTACDASYSGPIKWQFVGPVTLGMALLRAGVAVDIAFDVALNAVRSHTAAIFSGLSRLFPHSEQVVMFDEPLLNEAQLNEFPIAPDETIDLVSSALAGLEHSATVGIHCCDDADWAHVLAAGPSIISLPVRADLARQASYVSRFLEAGGVIMWGAVVTDGVLSYSAERPWRELNDAWAVLTELGCDPLRLRQQSMISPVCGLGLHSDGVAEHVFDLVSDVSDRVQQQVASPSFRRSRF